MIHGMRGLQSLNEGHRLNEQQNAESWFKMFHDWLAACETEPCSPTSGGAGVGARSAAATRVGFGTRNSLGNTTSPPTAVPHHTELATATAPIAPLMNRSRRSSNARAG
jgi:hypothetical protein